MEGVSIVIVTCNRIEYVRRLFDSLDVEIKAANELLEVIIIDNSRVKDSITIENLCKMYGYEFHFMGRSISEARNHGMKIAKFPIILFIDSDCEVVPGIIREHIISYTDERIGGVLGLTDFIGKENWLWKAIENTTFHIAFSFAKRMDYTLWGPCTNISFRKDVIEKVGGFRVEFPFNFSGEDVDLGLRINEFGYRIKCNPNAMVNHRRETWIDYRSFCKKIFRWGRTDFHILQNHSYLSDIDFPKFTTILLFLFVFSLFFKLVGFGWMIFNYLMIWLFGIPFIVSFLKTYKSKFRKFSSIYISFWLIFIFEFGSVFESLRKGSLLMLSRKLLYGKEQVIFEWDSKVIQSWSYTITFLIFLLIMLLKR
jgi:glycosyltransferase involved in cell wall biosynthesis